MKNTINSLNDAEKSFVASVINNLGSGQHPVADSNELEYFKLDYVKKLLKKCSTTKKLNVAGKEMANNILTKLN